MGDLNTYYTSYLTGKTLLVCSKPIKWKWWGKFRELHDNLFFIQAIPTPLLGFTVSVYEPNNNSEGRMNYGGLGGVVGGREPNQDDEFENMVTRVFGERMKTDDELCKQIWGALANVDWYKPETHESASYSFRAAGDMIASIRGSGDYMDWYCSHAYPSISDEIRRSFKKEGWIADDLPGICDVDGCLESASCGWSESKGKYRHTCGEHTREHRPND